MVCEYEFLTGWSTNISSISSAVIDLYQINLPGQLQLLSFSEEGGNNLAAIRIYNSAPIYSIGNLVPDAGGILKYYRFFSTHEYPNSLCISPSGNSGVVVLGKNSFEFSRVVFLSSLKTNVAFTEQSGDLKRTLFNQTDKYVSAIDRKTQTVLIASSDEIEVFKISRKGAHSIAGRVAALRASGVVINAGLTSRRSDGVFFVIAATDAGKLEGWIIRANSGAQKLFSRYDIRRLQSVILPDHTSSLVLSEDESLLLLGFHNGHLQLFKICDDAIRPLGKPFQVSKSGLCSIDLSVRYNLIVWNDSSGQAGAVSLNVYEALQTGFLLPQHGGRFCGAIKVGPAGMIYACSSVVSNNGLLGASTHYVLRMLQFGQNQN